MSVEKSTRRRLAELNIEFAKLDGICTRQMGRIAELVEMLRRAEWWISTQPDGARMAAAIRLIVDGAPADGSCVRCGAAPRNASGLCATCLDEDAVRAGEIPITAFVASLEWSEYVRHDGEPVIVADHEFGSYNIERDHFSVVPWELIAGGRVIGNFDTVQAAKTEAQKNFASRVLRCLGGLHGAALSRLEKEG